MEDDVALMPSRDKSASRAQLVVGGCDSFISHRSGKVLKATEDQRISTQVGRIPREKISINVVSERQEKAGGVYALNNCFIPAEMGKYIPVQMNGGVTEDVQIEINNKTVPELTLPEIVYNI